MINGHNREPENNTHIIFLITMTARDDHIKL